MKPAVLLLAILMIVVSVSLVLGTSLLSIVPSQMPTPDSIVLYGHALPDGDKFVWTLPRTATSTLTQDGIFTGISIPLILQYPGPPGTYDVTWKISCGASGSGYSLVEHITTYVALDQTVKWYTFPEPAPNQKLYKGYSCQTDLSSPNTYLRWIGGLNGITDIGIYIWGKPMPAGPALTALTASFTYTKAGLKVSFVDTSTGSPTSWAWTFGDTLTGVGPTINKTYSVAGTYSVRLTATRSADGATSSAVASITVTPTSSGSGSSTQAPIEGTEDEVPCDPVTETVENGVCVPIPQPFPWALLVLVILIVLISVGFIVIIINLFG